MIPIVTPAEMRAIDQAAAEPLDELIARAAWHVASKARRMLGGVYGRRVAAVAGPGNNGQDARVAADLLRSWGVQVALVEPTAAQVPGCDLVVDGAFGTGTNRAYTAPVVPTGVPVLAVDIPSGVDGLTGACLGSPMPATATVTFAALKPGLLLQPGATFAASVAVAPIGLDTSGASAWLFTEHDARRLLPRRLVDDHKWKRAVWVIGGSAGMYGAPLLAAQAALRSGTGIVWCGLPGQPPPSSVSEVVFRTLPADGWHRAVLDEAERFGSLVVGCGLGRTSGAAASVQSLIAASNRPTVIDGDALRLLGERPVLRANTVLTPHDGEFEALTGRRPGADRFAEARLLSASTGATVLLKGPLTIVAGPDGRCIATNSGDARLATAGTGDVLAGVVGSMLAAGLDPLDAAALGAWLHGAAGRIQPALGMVASDLLPGLATVAGQLLATDRNGGSNASN